MKKKLLLFLSAGLCYITLPAQFTVSNFNVELQHTDITVIDWDSDGDLDLLISGESGGINMVAYLNNGLGTYTATTVPFTPITRSSFSWDDINMDGKPDLLESGFGASGAVTKIYNSNGTGVFTANPLVLPQMSPTSGFADFNNDGYTDIYVFGNNDQGKSKIFLNDKLGGFTDTHALDAYTFKFDPDATVIDYDNDKDLDIYISASETETGARFSRLFRNTNGVFAEVQTFLPEKGYGSSVWGDYDGDGYLDLLCNGVGTPGDDFKYRIFKNNAGASFTLVDSYTYGQFSTGDGGKFFDFDNDGDLDFIITGWTGTRQATAVYINTLGVFTEFAGNAALPGVSESSVEVGDIDNDSDLDVFINGFSGNDFDGGAAEAPYNKNVTFLLRNDATLVNTAPAAPTTLNATGNQDLLTLSWNASTDLTPLQPANGLSYNLFLVDATGKWFYYPLADTTSGKLMLQRLGNVNLNKGWIVKDLPAGTYRWGVQAVDNSFMGSTFAKSTFTINADGSLPVVLKTFAANADGKKARIEWSTASEQNNDKFELQRSSDGNKFFHLATVKGKGTTSSVRNYTAYDNNPSTGKNFYRLIQYNFDGHATDHGIKTVNFNGAAGASVLAFPNPVQSSIGIRLSNFEGRQIVVTVTDMMGKQIHGETIQTDNGQGDYKLKMSKPVSGQYIILLTGEGLKQTLNVIVK